MKLNLLKKAILSLVISAILVQPFDSYAQEGAGPSGIIDESLQDITVVAGAGIGGAILGLSTLSFVDKPGDHLKNIAVGGAIGIVIGVGLVIFNQATKSQTVITKLDSTSVESLARLDFSHQKIAQNYLTQPTFDLKFSF